MAQHSPKEFMRVIQWVDPDAHAATTDMATVASEIDTLGFRFLVVIVNVGDSAGVWPIQLEAGAVSGTLTAVSGALFSVGLTSDDDFMVGVIDLYSTSNGANRYWDISGAEDGTGIIDLGVTAILWGPQTPAESIDFSSGGADELTFEL